MNGLYTILENNLIGTRASVKLLVIPFNDNEGILASYSIAGKPKSKLDKRERKV